MPDNGGSGSSLSTIATECGLCANFMLKYSFDKLICGIPAIEHHGQRTSNESVSKSNSCSGPEPNAASHLAAIFFRSSNRSVLVLDGGASFGRRAFPFHGCQCSERRGRRPLVAVPRRHCSRSKTAQE